MLDFISTYALRCSADVINYSLRDGSAEID